jgi:hypothetical protein
VPGVSDVAPVRYRIRWVIALTTTLWPLILGGILLITVLRPLVAAIPAATAVVVIFGAMKVIRVRRRSLTATASGLDVQRDFYAIHVPWSSITGVQNRRLQGILSVEELTLSDVELIGRDSRDRTRAIGSKVSGHPATTRIQISLYDPAWRGGPIGRELARRGVIEGAPTP